MTILLLGGRGKTTSRIAPLLHTANLPFLVASRSTSPDSPYRQAHFDWLDETTYRNPLQACAEEGMDPVSAVWLVPPPIYEMGPPMNKFVDFARSKGVGRFVLLSATIIEKGGEAMGQVHEYLASLKGIEFVVLRPTWFMENFSAPKELQRLAIKDEDKIYSAAGDGKVPFISTNDIARVAMHALTDRKLQNTERIIVGPELLTYDQVADILTKTLGRKITHARLTESELAKHFQSSGMSAEQAEWEAAMDTGIKKGGEERMNNVVEEITGVPPQRFYDFAEKEKQSWKKDG